VTRSRNVLSVAGSDPGGGAGSQADLRMFAKAGVHGGAVITALTVQTETSVSAVNLVSPDVVASQIDAVFSSMDVDAVKTGMLGNAAIVRAIAGAFSRHGARNVVVDPVLMSSSGTELLDAAGLDALRTDLLPIATIVTPNAREAGALLRGPAPTTIESMHDAARRIVGLGTRWAVVTGGHVESGAERVDVLSDGRDTHELRVPRVAGKGIHGSGCRYSAALAAALARGADVPSACAAAQRFVAGEIRESIGMLPPLGRLYLVATPRPHMNDAEFLARLRAAVEGGVDVLQLRCKDLEGASYARLAERAGAIAAAAGIPFIINDRVDVALAVNADGVHLGQHDLPVEFARGVLPRALIGRSSHAAADVTRAMQERADYFAVGPVWETPTKPGRKAAGLQYVREIAALNVSIPWYAIGGIDSGNVHEVIDAGATRIAVVRAILDAADPATAAGALKAALDRVPAGVA
jgi:hydroxymethylpyrimidine kinase/phosphomethylpyrimidine kinase/thiamine-phosphate diphosphorylase